MPIGILIVAGWLALNPLDDPSATEQPATTPQPANVQPEPAPPPPSLEIVAQLQGPPGNLAVTPDGRLIVSMHPFGSPKQRVLEIGSDGQTKPFPNERWSEAPDPSGKTEEGIQAIIGIECDRDGVVWMLDMGSSDPAVAPKLVAWDTKANSLKRTIPIPPPVAQPESFMQDFAVDLTHHAVFIADTGRGDLIGQSNPAIIVVDLQTGASRRRLSGHGFLQPEDVPIVIEGKPIRVTNASGDVSEPRLGLNPITIDPHDEWVYFGSMHGTQIFRVRALDLIHPALDDDQLARVVEKYGPKGVSDGISIDSAGNIYVTDLNNMAIGVLTAADRAYRLLVEDPRLLWPDGLSYGADGQFYVTVNQLHRFPMLNAGKDESKPPFLIVRFKPLAASAMGR